MQPTVGRIVHYYVDDGFDANGKEKLVGPLAGIVTAVRDADHASLTLFTELGCIVESDVPQADQPTAGHWTWPPRV